MSTFKKVISIVLCISMLAGSFAILGDLATPEASAAEGTSEIDSYEALDAKYDNYIYFGTEVYEIETDTGDLSGTVTDSILTDYYVDAGQMLEFKLYVKSDMYCGNGNYVEIYDNAFFDVTQLTSADPNSNAGYTQGLTGVTNADHPVVKKNGIKYGATSANCYTTGWIKNTTGFDQATLEAWDFTQQTISYNPDYSDIAYRFSSDLWFVSWYAKVQDTVKEGDTGVAQIHPAFWKCGDLGVTVNKSNQKQGNIAILQRDPNATAADDEAVIVDHTASMFANYTQIGAFLYDDACHTFTCGANPADAGDSTGGSVEGVSKIDSLADLDAKYDNYIYFGTEVYEIETDTGDLSGTVTDSILTDYYVDAGQMLEFKLYVKSDMYCGNGNYVEIYDNAFFDVTQLTSEDPNSNAGYTQGLTGVTNADHPVVKKNGIKYGATSANCYATGWMKNTTGFDQATLEAWDFTQQTISYNPDYSDVAYRFSSDLWFVSWYAKVQDTVKEGDTGVAQIHPAFWKCGDLGVTVNKSNQKQGNIAILQRDPNATAADDEAVIVDDTASMFANYTQIGAFLYDDACHTFTCGTNPAAGTVKKYNVTFLENDGSTISSADYIADAALTVPAAVENQLGWADTATGKLVDLTDYKVTRKAEFKRVLSTDEFAVTVSLGGGAIDEAALPENASIDENGNVVIKAALNEEIDLTTLPVPEKTGYTASWNPEKVTVDTIKGATAAVVWTANTYTVKFYNNKGDAEPVETVTATYNVAASSNKAVAEEGYKFAGWADADTDEVVSTTQSLGKYTYTEDKEFYATWTKYDSSITIMVRDYENGSGWKVGTVKYNDAGKSLNSNQTKSALAEAAAAANASVAYMPATTTPYIYDNEAASGALVDVSAGLSFDGAKVYYLCTTLDFNVTWKIPVYDEATDSFTGYDATEPVKVSTGSNKYTATVKTTADTTPPSGYVFKGWINEATGETVEYNANLGVTLDYTYGTEVAFVADFQEAEYTIVFNMQNGDFTDKLTLGSTVKKGEAIDVEGETVTNTSGKEVSLPVIGKENSEQPTPFISRNGYKFVGWQLGTGANAVDVTLPVDELTAEMIGKYAVGQEIEIYAKWEALEYELRFFYVTSDTDLTLPVADRKYAEPIVVKYKTGEIIDTDVDAETLALIEASTPEGYGFLQFGKLEAGAVDSKMPAYGLDLYARYTKETISIYVDYNNNKVDEEGNALPLKDTMALSSLLTLYPVYYGDDVEREANEEEGTPSGTGILIKRSIITDGNRPGENYEVVDWKVYHVEDGADIYDTANWKEGVNDEGSTNAYSTLIYQPQWKHHTEFLFRVYGTDGKIYMALGKNLKLYYWNNNYVAERGETKLNKDPENLVILLLIPEIENWDWDRFFDASMWSSLTLRFDPIFAPKSMFTIESFIALMKALGTLIGNLF